LGDRLFDIVYKSVKVCLWGPVFEEASQIFFKCFSKERDIKMPVYAIQIDEMGPTVTDYKIGGLKVAMGNAAMDHPLE